MVGEGNIGGCRSERVGYNIVSVTSKTYTVDSDAKIFFLSKEQVIVYS